MRPSGGIKCCASRRCLAIQSEISPEAVEKSDRRDIVFEDFQKETYEGWTVTGDAFGKGPILKSDIPDYQGDVGTKGPRVVNSHASAPGRNVTERDSRTGTLTSKPFTIERKFIRFWIGGGNHPGETCINLLVDGKVVRTATGHDSNQMRQDGFDVRKLQGKTARLEIVDKATGAWGNIGVGPIVFSDRRPAKGDEQHDVGTLALALLEPVEADQATPAVGEGKFPAAAFAANPQPQASPAGRPQAGRFDRSQAGPGSRPGSDRHLRHRLAFPAAEAQGRRQVLCHPFRQCRRGRRAPGGQLRCRSTPRPVSGTTPGTIRRFPTGSSIARS